ncbi:MAG TPA: DUF4142 domain-containing protein [Opitutaceae bacterium]|nr:DUF4142 domain-containing protein [Opitutaceae bacterium]
MNSLKVPTLSRSITVGMLALGLGSGMLLAQTTDREAHTNNPHSVQSPRAGASLSRSDRNFLEKSTKLGREEMVLSEVAADRGIHQDVRALASKMVTAHAAVNADLAALVAKKGVALPHYDENDSRKLQKQWAEKKAENFDKDYLKGLIDAHEDSVDLLEKAVKSDDTDIASFAGKYLSTFKQHLNDARALKDRID